VTKRDAFEVWVRKVRVQPNMTKKRSGEYMDMDTDWLWRAFDAGAAFASDRPVTSGEAQ
jgi:hypothetical protein